MGLLSQAKDLHERLPAYASLSFSMDAGALASIAMTSYPASAHIRLGDFENARVHAQAALDAHENFPAPGREAIARIDLGIALAALGEPDEAAALGQQALRASRWGELVRSRSGDLDTRHAQDFHELYRQMSAVTSSAGLVAY